MIASLLAAAALVVRVDPLPPAAGTGVVELVCRDGTSHTRIVPFGEAAPLAPPCPPVTLVIRAEGYVTRTVTPTAGQGEIHVTLEKKAVASLGPGAPAEVAVAWRPSSHQPPEVVRLGPSAPRAGLTPGDGCLAAVRPECAPQLAARRLSPGEAIGIPLAPWSRGVGIAGEVLDPDGLPVAATVRVRRDPENPGNTGPDPCDGLLEALGVTQRATERSGRFALGPLGPGRFQLQAAAEGYASLSRTVVLAPGGPAVDVGTIVLQPVASLNVLVDPKLAAMEPPFTLDLARKQEDAVLASEEWKAVRHADIGDELTAAFDDLPPGYYRLTLRKSGTDLVFVQEIELARGARQDVVLRPAPMSVVGTVRRRQRGVGGAEVWLRAVGADIRSTSDELGAYAARVWTPADYAVVVTLEGDPSPFPAGHLDLRTSVPGDTVVHDVDLPAAGVTGTVLDGTTGKPVAGARVKLVEHRTDENLMSTMSVTTDGEGRFAFPYLTAGARDHLEATADGYLPAAAAVDTSGRTDQHLIVTLDRGIQLKGRVRGPAGEPVVGATVACCAPTVDGRFGVSTQTAGDGSFTLTLAEGSTVWGIARGYAVGWAVAGTGEMELRLPAPASAPGLRLRTASGDPVARSKVTFSTERGVVIPWQALAVHALLHGQGSVSGTDGRLAPSGLGAGVYQAWLISATGLVPLGLVPVPSASEITVEVPIRRGR